MTKEPTAADWPTPKLRLSVDLGVEGLHGVAFQEVSGIDTTDQAIEYRFTPGEGDRVEKIPGPTTHGNVTLKRGIMDTGTEFQLWYQQVQLNTIARTTVTIQLLNDQNVPQVTWTLANAWPIKVQIGVLKSDANEAAIDLLELAYESLSVTQG